MVQKNINKETLETYLKDLRLPAMRASYSEILAEATANSVSYEGFLMELLERECESRNNRKTERFLKESKLPLEKSMSTFDLKRYPQTINQKVKILLEGDFLDRQENLLIFGNPGSGKTHLSCAIAQELIYRGRRIYFSTCNMLVQELLIAKKNLRLKHLLKKLSKYEGIIIDDIGYVQQNRAEMEVLFTLMAERYERGSIMITSNLPFSEWEKIFKDPMTTAAAIDRMVHHSVIMELNVKSYRLETAEKDN